jgi:hypothetical protein
MSSSQEDDEQSEKSSARTIVDPFEELCQRYKLSPDSVLRTEKKNPQKHIGNLFLGAVVLIVVIACAIYYYQSYQKDTIPVVTRRKIVDDL